jgi:hypothetical protein
MTRFSQNILAVAILIAPSLGGCSMGPQVWIESQETLRFPASQVQALAAKTHNGPVVVRPAAASENEIVVIVDKRAGGATRADAEACMAAIHFETPVEAGVQHVRYRFSPAKRLSWGERISYNITMPPGLAARVETHNGPITVEDLAAGAALSTHNGEITVRGLRGELTAETHNGEIVVENHEGKMVVESHNGEIRAVSTASDFDVTTHNGDIHLNVGEASDRITGQVETHNGEVRVKLPAEASAQLDASTHNGGITCRHALSDVSSSRRELRGRLGQGAGKVNITSHNGSIVIE